MLVLTRRIGERLFIGDDIKITMLEVHGNQVRIGIEAPQSVHVVREEIADRPYVKATATKDVFSAPAHDRPQRLKLRLYGKRRDAD